MADNLIKAGFEVTVHNRTRSREEPLEQLGAVCAASPAAAAAEAAVVLTCVADTPDVESVLLDAERGVINGLRPGGLVIDCSSIEPEATRRIARAFRARDIGYVDAPVSGGSEGAIKGTLTVMCGGSEEDFELAQPVLQVIGSRVTRIGPVGCGQIAKVANQVVITGTFFSLAEALTLAYRAGADPERVVEAIGGGWPARGSSTTARRRCCRTTTRSGSGCACTARIWASRWRPRGRTTCRCRSRGLVATIEDGLIAQGYGDEDMSNLARFVRRGAGIPDGPLKTGG